MKKLMTIMLALSLCSCASLNESLTLGASLGAASGAAATFTAYRATSGHSPEFQDVLLGAGIGSAVGLFTSYLVHQKVVEQRQAFDADSTDMHFGDLPPSPFVVPRTLPKKGTR